MCDGGYWLMMRLWPTRLGSVSNEPSAAISRGRQVSDSASYRAFSTAPIIGPIGMRKSLRPRLGA